MKKRNFHLGPGAMEACTKSITEATKGIDQRGIKGNTNDCFLFESWFFSKKLTESIMDVVADIIGMVKTTKKDHVRIP